MKKFLIGLLMTASAIWTSASMAVTTNEYPMFWTWMDYRPGMNFDSICQVMQDIGMEGIMLNAPTPDDYRKAIPVANKHGIEVYAWLWTMNLEHDRDKVMSEHPEWLSVNRNGKSLADTTAYVGYYKFMCPALPEVRRHINDRIKEYCEVEGLNGIAIDYHRMVDVVLPTTLWPNYGIVQDREYGAWDYGYHPEMIRLFKEKYGYDPRELEDPSLDVNWRQFRCDQITEVANMIAETVHSYGKKMAASPFPTPKMASRMVRQDWGKWDLDIVFPMVYDNFYTKDPSFIADCTIENVRDKNPKTTLYCGLMAGNGDNLFDNMDAALANGAQGIALFTVSGLRSPELRKKFRQYTDKAKTMRTASGGVIKREHPTVADPNPFSHAGVMKLIEARMRELNGTDAPLALGDYKLKDTYDATRVYEVADDTSGNSYEVSFYLYGDVLMGWDVKKIERAKTDLAIIPYPMHVCLSEGSLEIPAKLTYSTNLDKADLKDLMAYLPEYEIQMKKVSHKGFVRLNLDGKSGIPDEGYKLKIDAKGVHITASTTAGIFYGLQSLAQLARGNKSLPYVDITDSPRFPYRGMHIDVSRHFFDKDYIKKQLNQVSSYKINRMHWHLTDGAGWRLEIPGYPKLTEFAAWRKPAGFRDWSREGGHYCDRNEDGAYGGYFTAEDVREIVEYARLRHITVIPEIEMPGHSSEVVAAYPELGCTGEQYGVGEVCIGNEQTFKFFEDVLDEVVKLFPSHYIHVGGDEANQRHWKNCPKCQQRMKDEGLKNESELQAYMMARIERYLNGKGRDIIGWDEILDGGVAPNATIMSWRGEEGAIKAARQHHYAIMTPESHCYLDHYQDDPETQPLAFGAVVSLAQTYSLNPISASLEPELGKYILGAQGNTWAEYIPTPQHHEYMLYPRIIALAEVGWTTAERKDFEGFKHRVNNEIRHLRNKGFNPFTMSEQVQVRQEMDYRRRRMLIHLTSEKDPIDIRYTLDGSEPNIESPLYKKPIEVRDSVNFAARLFDGTQALGNIIRKRYDYHKGIGRKVTYTSEGNYYHDKEAYKGGGDSGLVDGLRGGKSYMDGRWQGFSPNDMDVTVDLGRVQPVKMVKANFMQMTTPQVYLPAKTEVWLSEDGKNFTLMATDECPITEKDKSACFRDFGWEGEAVPARYVRFHAVQNKRSPYEFLFTDEIVIQ